MIGISFSVSMVAPILDGLVLNHTVEGGRLHEIFGGLIKGGGVGWFANDLHTLVNINVLFFIPATANPLYREFQFLHSYTSDAGFGR